MGKIRQEKLLQTLNDHFRNVMERTNIAIRATMKVAYQSLKTIHPSGAKDTIKETPEEAETTWTEKAETWKRNRSERAANLKRAKKTEYILFIDNV